MRITQIKKLEYTVVIFYIPQYHGNILFIVSSTFSFCPALATSTSL